MNKFLSKYGIIKLSKKEDISFNDLILLFFRIIPLIIIILSVALILSYINFVILKNNKAKSGELYKSEIVISNFTIINPEDPYFIDINMALKQPININALLRNISISNFLQTNSELNEKYKAFGFFEFTKPDLEKHNKIDLIFSIYSNSPNINEFKESFSNYLYNFALSELEILFEYKISQEEFQISSLEKILQKLKDIAEQETLDRLSKRMEIYEDIKQKVTLANKFIKNEIRVKKSEFITNLFNYLPEDETLEFLEKTDLYSLSNFFNLNDPEDFDLSFLTEINSAAAQENPLLEIKINPTLDSKINDKSFELDILNNYLDRIKLKDKNLMYFENFTYKTHYNTFSFTNLATYYLIISFLLTLFIFYAALLTNYIINNKKNNS
tara:strand:- start:53510 stop:54664 length:1155 start_codon:yes stop_codon:yes gene_type:complete